jgi:phage-related protein
MLPARKITRVSIPDRDGSYVFEDGFENKTLEFACILAKGSLQQRRTQAREIAAWLSGTGELILDHELGRSYKTLRTVSDVSLTLNNRRDDFHISFEAEPFQYGSLQTTSIDNPTSVVITNNGTAKAETLLSVTGTGNVTVSCGNQAFTLAGITEKINLDSRKMLVYTDLSENRMQSHTGGFLKLAPGANTINVTGTVSNLSVQFYDTYL